MARKGSPTILEEELYPASAGPLRNEATRDEHPRAELDDARLVDLDVAEESPFLRGQKRVSARRSSLPKKTASRVLWACIAVGILGIAAIGAVALYNYGEHSWRFRIESSDNIEVTGMQNVTKPQIMEVMGADIGRNIFFIPLSLQKTQLEQIPWVESASVMRFVPNRLEVEIHERTPVAFARVGPRIFLIDAHGILMDLPPKHKYSFPVILGMNPGEPLSTRVPRMKAYNELVAELDSSGARYSQDLSEVDVSDLDNIKVRVNDPQGDVLVELGSSDYLKRYITFVGHVKEWRQQFQKLESVNLRYDNQVIVNPDMEGRPKQPTLSASAARAAAAAGVKPAALVTRLNPHDRTVPKPAFQLSDKTLNQKAATTKKPAAKPKPSVAKASAARKPSAPWAKPSTTKKRSAAAPAAVRRASAPAVPKADRRPPQSAPVAANATPKPSPAIAKPSAGSN
jgi:cell division protein FtsQ